MQKQFLIKSIYNADMKKELEIIGYDKSYRKIMSDKFFYKTLKIYGLTVPQANILKQLALSLGADCATHREVIVGKIENSDAILGGSFSQLKKLAEKLSKQPFSLSTLAENIKEQLFIPQNDTKIVGILNLTNNSFSDGGLYNTTEKACEHLKQLVKDGADIIDIGAESTKPNTEPISSEEQLEKILPVLNYIKEHKISIPISIDTRNSIVAEECLKNGATIINDVSGLKYDNNMAKVVAKYDATLILQHSLGNKVNTSNGNYKNVVDEVFIDLAKQIEFARNNGINKIIIDVGIGFDKSLEDNFKILNRINEFKSLNLPIMTGISRKSLLDIQNNDNLKKDIYTTALNTLAIEHRIDYIRVHNVKMHRKLIELYKNNLV